MNKKSQTDWEALESMTDEEIDMSDIPPLTDKFFAHARLFIPNTEGVELDADVLAWFKSHSQNYQKQINKVLRQYIELQPR